MASARSSSNLTGAQAREISGTSSNVNDSSMVEGGGEMPEIKKPEEAKPRQASTFNSLIDGFLNLLSSVPFGIVLLVLLIIASMIGMLIQQQELETFQGYYAELTPGEKIVYGRLGFFDIYHAWYFNLLLLFLSLNIILASIDRFPTAWSYISKKKLTASPTFALAQRFKDQIELPGLDRQELVKRASAAARAMKFKVRATDQDGRTTVYAERGVWNRLGAYVVHIGLLTIFAGGFMTSRGYTGMMQVTPDQTTDRMAQNVFNIEKATNQLAISQRELVLPFKIEGLDIQQKLIKKEGPIDASNTLDWLTRVRIHDNETGKKTEALIHMNSPYDYRGYRFFQASFNPMGNARTIKVRVIPPGGGTAQEIELMRNREARLADGTRFKYIEFNPHLILTREGGIDFGSTEYENPAAHLLYIRPDGQQGDAWAFTEKFMNEISNAPFIRSKLLREGSYQLILADFEKVPLAHTLSVQYDPGAKIVYLGFAILCFMLVGVFFFSHQRLWIVVEDGKVSLGGDSNRNRLGFEDRAKKLIALIHEPGVAK